MEKIALVTGASRGIGASVARVLASNYRVIVNYKSNEKLAKEVVSEIIESGGVAEIFQADVSKELDVLKMFKYIKTTYKRIDALVNNAGITADGFLMSMSIDNWNKVMNNDLTSVFLCCREASKMMHYFKIPGKIVNISSVSGLIGKEAVDEYGSFFEITHSLDKKKAKQQTELIEGKYVEQTYHLKEYLIEFFINIENQNMGKVYIRNYIQIELLQNDSILFIKSYQSLEIAISFYGKTNYVNTEQISLKEDGMYKIHILEKVKRIHIEFSVLTISLEIYPRPIQKEERMLICRQDKVFELDNGYLRFYKDGNPLFVEMWPCLTRPLLFGYLIPRKVNLKQEKIENNKYIVLEVKQAYIIHREYLFEPNKVKIHSYADIIEKTIIEPIFHIAFDNLKYKCSIITNNEIVNKKYDAINDRKYCNEEIIYEYFGKESYVENVMQEVLLTFENEEYRITTKENMYCFHQYNYIGFSFIKPSKILEKHIIKENVKVELGTIVIERRG